MTGKILVVDDVATNRIILKAKLAVGCHDVIQAADGHEAIAAAQEQKPDLILLDLAMPGLDGIEVLRRLKRAPETASIPVVVVTSFADTRSKIAALRAGAEDFLSKPVDDMVLSARVRSILRARVLAEELELREGTRRALGFSEMQADYLAAARPANNMPVEAAAPGAERQARIALIGPNAETAEEWRAGISAYLPHRIDIMRREDMLRLARGGRPAGLPMSAPSSQGAPGDTGETWATDAAVPEVFVVSADITGKGDGLMLLAELRANQATRNAAILVVVGEGSSTSAIALDLGASDLLTLPLEPEEVALRLTTQLARSRAVEAMRRRLRDGLQMAVTDPLTGLHNRRYALSHLERVTERAASRGRPCAAMVVDLDRFKSVNDMQGHAAGDAVLREVARRLQDQLQPVDLVARLGGEEFLIVLPDTDLAMAEQIGEALRDAVASLPIALPHGPLARGPQPTSLVHQTVSIGVAVWPPHARTFPAGAHGPRGPSGGAYRAGDHAPVRGADAAAALVEAADRALYVAKRSGRDRVFALEADLDDTGPHAGFHGPHPISTTGRARQA